MADFWLDHLDLALKEQRGEMIKEFEEELINGNLRDNFERYFEKDNIDAYGNYLNRKSTTNRSGALAYLGDITAYLRGLLSKLNNPKQ
mgnify:CR=1 FL=1